MNHQLYIYDCLSSKLRVSDGSFMTIGAGENNTFRMEMEAANAGSFAQRDEQCRFFPHSKIGHYSVNGEIPSGDVMIHPDCLYLFVLSGGCFIAWYGDASNCPDFSLLSPHEWFLYNCHKETWVGPIALEDIPSEMTKLSLQPTDLASFGGLENKAFYLRDIIQVALFRKQNRNLKVQGNAPPQPAQEGSFICPNCWETYRAEDVFSIAACPDLMGDDILGDEAMRRFHPSTFDEQGMPLDDQGYVCTGYACPHCRLKLPPFFHQTEQHIISLVGVPSAGKSYYLASMLNELKKEFARDFGISFRDADPVNNAPLNDMSLRILSARTPQEAYIGKTRLRGRLYHKVWQRHHFINMPRPFVYNLNKGNDSYSVVLYDNAGENYAPGQDSSQLLSTNHLSKSSGILFLFDPTANPGFRTMLKGHTDPQLRHMLHLPGRQSTFLAETEMRLRTRLNLPPNKKINVPLAVIVGKSDIWNHLLGPEPLLPIVRNGMYVPAHVDINSARIRQLLFNAAPATCTNAEAISDNVRYFAVSSFGKSPIEFKDEETGAILIGPESGELRPSCVTDPLLWVLSIAEPSLLPCSQN